MRCFTYVALVAIIGALLGCSQESQDASAQSATREIRSGDTGGTRELVTSVVPFDAKLNGQELSPIGKGTLDRMMISIRKMNLELILVVGYASDLKNRKVDSSQSRAEQHAAAVKAYLVKAGIAESRIYTQGKVITETSNDGDRVEIEAIGMSGARGAH